MGMRLRQAAMTGGELAEDIYERVDIEEFGVGLKTAYNVIIHKTGGASARAGTEHIFRCPDGASYAYRLTPFEFNTEQAYINAWGHLSMNVAKDGALVLEASKAIVSISLANPGSLEVTGHSYSVNDTVYVSSATGMTNFNARYFKVNSVPDANHVTLKDLYGTPINTTTFSAYVGSGVIARAHKVTTPYSSNADPNATANQVFYMDLAQSNDEAYVAHLSITPQKLTRSGHNAWSINAQVFAATISAPGSVAATATTGSGAITYNYVVTAINDITGEESVASTADNCTNDLSADPTYKNTITWAAASGASRYNIYKEENGVFGFIGGTIGLSFVDGPGGSAGGEITPDLSITPPLNYNPFDGATNYPACVEFHEARLVYGQLTSQPGVVLASQPTRFSNFNRSVPARSDDVVIGRLLPGVNAVQGMCSLGDVLFCATASSEFTISGSGVVNYLTPASAMPHMWSEKGADRLKPLKVAGYSLYIAKQGQAIHAFGPSETNPNKYVSIDLTVLAPHLFEDHFIVDWCYQQDPHGIVWLVRDDGILITLTFLPEFKIFAFTRVAIAGSVAGAAVVESCACIPGATEDEVYLAVKRTINGVVCRDVEKMKSLRWGTSVSNYWGLDNAQRFSGAATNTFDGLHHLEGQTNVAALADGFLVTGLTVTAGRVTLPTSTFPNGASVVLIGLLPDDPEIAPLPVVQLGAGRPSTGRRKKVIGVTLRLKRSCAVFAGSNEDTLHPLKMRTAQTVGATPPYSGSITTVFNGKYAKDGTFLIRGTAGLPMTITAFIPEIDESKSKVKLADADA